MLQKPVIPYKSTTCCFDHNFHADRDQAQYKSGEYLHSGKFRKQMKKWDATQARTKKLYEYIPVLMEDVLKQRSNTSNRLKDRVILEENHPKRQQSTIGNTEPLPTVELVTTKRSCFN